MERDEAVGKAIRAVLTRLNSVSTAIEASAIMSRDGHCIESVLGKGIDSARLSAMCASMLALAEKTALELQRGRLKQVLIEGEEGCVLVVQIGASAVLAVVSRPTANLGMVFVEARKTAQAIAMKNIL